MRDIRLEPYVIGYKTKPVQLHYLGCGGQKEIYGT